MAFKEKCRRAWPVAALFGLLLSWRLCVLISFGPLTPSAPPLPQAGFTDVRGVIHVHSDLSHDGRASLAEIADAALTTGLDFVYLTDHNSFGYGAKGQEGWMSGVLVLSGAELGTCDEFDANGKCRGGHMLALARGPFSEALQVKKGSELAAITRAHGGLAFAAHPGNRRVPWRGSAEGLSGFELTSLWTGLLDSSWPVRLSALAAYGFNPLWAMGMLTDNPAPEASHFDRASRQRRVTAIAGADAHASLEIRKGWKVAFPPMRHFFRLMTTHVLLAAPFAHEVEADRAALLSALSAGRAYICYEAMAPGEGFSYTAQVHDTAHPMGSAVPLGPTTLRVRAPAVPGAHLTLLCDGEPVARSDGSELTYRPTREGAYRCEAWLHLRSPFLGLSTKRPWILSNPIYVGGRYEQK